MTFLHTPNIESMFFTWSINYGANYGLCKYVFQKRRLFAGVMRLTNRTRYVRKIPLKSYDWSVCVKMQVFLQKSTDIFDFLKKKMLKFEK